MKTSSLASLLMIATTTLAQRPATVVTVPVERRAIASTVELIGSTRGIRRAVMASEVEGLVVELGVREGQSIAKGDVIGRLSSTLASSDLAAQKARLAAAEAELAELVAGTRPEVIAQALAAHREAVRVQRRWFDRVEKLKSQVRQGAKPVDELDDAEAEHDAAKLRTQRLEKAWIMAKNGPRRETIEASRARVAAAAAELRKLEDEEKRRVLRAPFSGFVTRLRTEIGEWVARGGAVAELVDISTLEVLAPLPQRFLTHLTKDARARIAFSADVDAKPLETTLDRIGAEADEKGRSVPLYFRLDNSDIRLRAGLSAHVIIDLGRPEPSLVVPKDCLWSRGGAEYVCVVEGGVVRYEFVSTGTRSHDFVAVKGELREGMSVVVRGNERLVPGQPVVEARRSAAEAAPGPSDDTAPPERKSDGGSR